MQERSIFMAALERETPAERSAFLEAACANDSALRQRVEELLRSHVEAGTFLGKPVVERLAEQLGTPRGTEDRLGNQLAADDDAPLEFLAPSNKPGHLGRLGHYEVVDIVGRGGMGIVLRAIDEKLQRVVAIKVMTPQLATSAAARKRFIREAQAAAAVSHDHVVTIHAVEEAGGLPYLAMQYVSGLSLQERLDKSGPLELREIVRIGMQMAAGLAAAHAQGLIHRDIKPANILLENGVERVKITDFGLARAVADASMTQTGMVAGTPQYMSPEQARGEALDRRSDLFSLGSVLYAMCTGRPPFRADSGIAVLRRVCDDTPRSIRETNSDIPEWLVAVVAKLHAKDPADRYQSAAEVAELLNGHLAHLQHPSVVPLPAVEKPARHAPVRRRLWATATAGLLCIAAGLGMTEAAGVTKLTASAIRVLTPEGTLVVEVDDPGVKVTVEGDGGLVITGAGPQEVRLRPGSYKLRATKDGKPVREEELITITRGEKRVVKVSHEVANAPATPTTIGPAGQPFVILGGTDAAERKFDTLAEAVLASSNGETIEIRGNGPFVSGPIRIPQTALTIRAGDSFRPIIKLSSDGVERGLPLLATNYALTLEGLELHRAPGARFGTTRVLQVDGAAFRAANCRFRSAIWAHDTPGCVFLNCEFLSEMNGVFGGQYSRGARFIFENCLHRIAGAALCLCSIDSPSDEMSVEIKRSTFMSGRTLWLEVKSPLATLSDRPQAAKPVRLEVSGSIFDAESVLNFEQRKNLVDKAGALTPAAAEAVLLRLMQWRGERNSFADGSTSIGWTIDKKTQRAHGPKNLQEWQRFWGDMESNPQEGPLRFQGGPLRNRTEGSLDQLTPEDFRLQPDSAGYRAGPDGKDLGANVDLVGPGPAYERWKKTPEYQEWLNAIGQTK